MKKLLIILLLSPFYIWAQKSSTIITNGSTSLANPNPNSILLIDPIKPKTDLYIITKSCSIDFTEYGKLKISTPAGNESVLFNPKYNIVFIELLQLLEENKKEISELKNKLKANQSVNMRNE